MIFAKTCLIGRELKAHKIVLAAQSEELKRRLYGQKPTRTLALRGDITVWQVLVKFCYNIRDPLPDRSTTFFTSIFKEAESYKISELQVLSAFRIKPEF